MAALSTVRGTSANTNSKHKVEVNNEVKDGAVNVKNEKPDVQQRCHCAECGKSFTRKSSLIVHQRVHTGEKLFMCTQCGKRFSLKSSMVRHLRIHISKTANKCPDCGKCFNRFSSLFQHQKVHKGDRPHRCRDLRKRFVETSEIVVHQRRPERKGEGEKSPNVPERVPIKACLVCGRSFRTISSFIRHQRQHGVKPLSPALGVYGLPNGGSVGHTSHIVRTDGFGQSEDEYYPAARNGNGIERRILCAECGKSFTRKSSLIVHQRVHTGERRFVCTQCGKRFSLKSSMVRHMGTHSPKILNICPDCGKCFSRYSSLFQHQKVHRRQKSFQRRPCEKSLPGASQLAAHWRIHTALWTVGQTDSVVGERDKDFISTRTCSSVCETGQDGEEGKDRCSKSRLNLVMNHSANKADRKDRSAMEHFLCSECGKSFTRKSSLLVHQRVHTGEKRFVCSLCGKRFGLKSSMVRHLRTHAPKTAIKCPDCGKCFTRYSSLYQHQKVHRRAKPSKCVQSVSRTSQLVVHQKTDTSDLDRGDKRNNHVINSSEEESHISVDCGQRVGQQDLLHQIAPTANGTSASSMTDAENHKNNDHQGCDTKDDKRTSCSGKDVTRRKADEVERGEGTKAMKSNASGRSSMMEKSYHCIECGKYFTRKSSLVVHQRVHTGEKLYMCTECGRRFAFKSSLVRHMRTHPGQPLNICSQCGIDFSRYQDLSVHIESHHSQPPRNHNADLKMEPDEQQWLSSDADKIVVSVPLMNESALLDRGQRSHYNQNPPPGEPLGDCVASSSFNAREITQGDSLNIKEEILENTCSADEHLEEHTDEETSLCPFSLDWGVEFDLSKALHKDNSENMESPLENCTLKSADNGPLGVSSWVHGSHEDNRAQCGGKPFLCAECGKSFTRKSSLIVHQRVHTGEKRFLCTQCGKRFGLKSSMVRHMRTHSSEMLPGPECGKAFENHSSLLQHQTSHNGNDPT